MVLLSQKSFSEKPSSKVAMGEGRGKGQELIKANRLSEDQALIKFDLLALGAGIFLPSRKV